MTALPTQPDRVATANQEELADEATKRQFESLGKQFGLDHNPSLAIQRLHLIADRRDRPLGE
jgi:hypothetical protein